MKVLYELVTVSGECGAIYATERLGRRHGMRSRKSGDLPAEAAGKIPDHE